MSLPSCPLCSVLIHMCQPSYCPKSHLNWLHFEWFAHETPALIKCNYVGTCIQHPQQKYQSLATHHICWNSSSAYALAHIAHVPKSWQTKWSHLEMASCWTNLEAFDVGVLHAIIFEKENSNLNISFVSNNSILLISPLIVCPCHSSLGWKWWQNM
jgi:hypothetical protein